MYTFKRYCKFYCTSFSVFVRMCTYMRAYRMRARVRIRVRSYVVHTFNGVYIRICIEGYELLIILIHIERDNVIKPCNKYAGQINYFTVCFSLFDNSDALVLYFRKR